VWSPPTAGVALCALAGAALAQTPKPATAKAASASISIPFEKYALPNGLTVVLAPDHAVPTVTVNIIYHVGSKNEQAGRTGFAHLFEHTMFTGSVHVPYGMQDRLTEGVGGANNAFTTNDVTNYYDYNLPSNYLEDALWLEADRLGWLLPALDSTKYNAQRDIVKNERRQSYDNQPYGRAAEIIGTAMYPSSNPYSWPVIGSMTDLSAATLEDVKNFFRTYYVPNNAALIVTGDFDPAQAKAWITKYFTEVPRGKPVVRPKVSSVTMAAEKRLYYEDRVQIPRLYVSWPVIGAKNDDTYALDVLADILTGSRTARLTKDLVYDKQWAASVTSSNNTNEDAGEFQITVNPRPGHTLTELEAETDTVLARFRREGPTADEMTRAKAGLQLSFVAGLESNTGKAQRLAFGQAYFDNPNHAFSVEYAKYQGVTAADIKRVANKYLTPGRVVLSVVPTGKKDQASKPDQSVLAIDTFANDKPARPTPENH
jgi:zinc protease